MKLNTFSKVVTLAATLGITVTAADAAERVLKSRHLQTQATRPWPI